MLSWFGFGGSGLCGDEGLFFGDEICVEKEKEFKWMKKIVND